MLQELDKIELNEDQICEVFVVLGRTKLWKEIKFARPTFEKIVKILSRTATTFILVDKHRALLLEA